jgi:hypothetical protein
MAQHVVAMVVAKLQLAHEPRQLEGTRVEYTGIDAIQIQDFKCHLTFPASDVDDRPASEVLYPKNVKEPPAERTSAAIIEHPAAIV